MAGLDFKSDKLWEKYIAWERMSGDGHNAYILYQRLLSTPTKGHATNFTK